LIVGTFVMHKKSAARSAAMTIAVSAVAVMNSQGNRPSGRKNERVPAFSIPKTDPFQRYETPPTAPLLFPPNVHCGTSVPPVTIEIKPDSPQ